MDLSSNQRARARMHQATRAGDRRRCHVLAHMHAHCAHEFICMLLNTHVRYMRA